MKMVDNHEGNSVGEDDNSNLPELVPTLTKVVTKQEGDKKPDTAFLYFIATTANVLLFVCSCHHVWTSPVLPKLRSNNTDINPLGRPITTIETSLLGGLPFLTGLFGSLFCGSLSDAFGRKNTMFFMALTVLLCSILMSLSNSVYIYIIARCIIFVNFSGSTVLIPLYLLEICEDHNRAKFACFMNLALPLGHLYTYIVGSSVASVKVFSFLCGAAILPYLLSLWIFAPESPVFLVAKGKLKLAIRALEKLRNNKTPQEIEKDCEKISETIKTKTCTKRVRLAAIFKTRVYRKALFLAFIPLATQHLSGVTVIMQFMGPIFNEAGTSLSGNTISIIAGVVKISMFFGTAMIVERLGRRPLLITSALGTGLTLFFLGLFFYWRHINWVNIDKVLWLPIMCLILNLLMYSIGLGPVSSAVMSEMFSGNTRAVGMSLVVTTNGVTIFLLNFLFPIIADTFGVYCCIWFFSSCSFIGAFMIYKFIPETKGKSILEIQEILQQ